MNDILVLKENGSLVKELQANEQAIIYQSLDTTIDNIDLNKTHFEDYDYSKGYHDPDDYVTRHYDYDDYGDEDDEPTEIEEWVMHEWEIDNADDGR